MGSLYTFLFAPIDKMPRSRQIFWLALSLGIALIGPLLAVQDSFASSYVVQDDARQHVFWMLRFTDPALFPGDLTADYFQSVAPWGYTTLYRLLAYLGVDALTLHKLLPIPIALIATLYGFGITLQILPLPVAGFLATLVLNQSLWMRDDIGSGTPVAFVYPIGLAFLYYLLRRSLLPCLVTILLQGWFYPQWVLVEAGLLLVRLLDWRQGRLRLSEQRSDYWFSATGLAVVVLVLLPYALKSSSFGPTMTAAEARQLFTFTAEGWSAFFTPDAWKFWICGKRSGMAAFEWCEAGYRLPWGTEPLTLRIPFGLPQIGLSVLLPLLMSRPQWFPLSRQVRSAIGGLLQLLLVSIVLFFVAHTLLFELHLPNRYSEHSLRLITSLAAGIALTIGLEALLHPWASASSGSLSSRRSAPGRWLRPIGAGLIGVFILLYPRYLWFEGARFPFTNYTTGEAPALYEFLQQQPKDSVIASLSPEVNNLPSFAQRSILVGGKGYVLPYHVGYYQAVSQRLTDLIQAQYSSDRRVLQQFIQQYEVDFWLLDRAAFTPGYLKKNPVFEEYAAATRAIRPTVRQRSTALASLVEPCTVLQTESFTVLDAVCLQQAEEL